MPRLVEVAVPLPLSEAFTYQVSEELAARLGRGARVRIPFGRRMLRGYVVGFPETTSLTKLKNIDELLDDPPLLTEELMQLTQWISEYYACSWGEALRAALPPTLHRKRGPKRGLQFELKHSTAFLGSKEEIVLSPGQETSLREITAALKLNQFKPFVLHGVTGSGKTEVYLRAIQQVLQSGRSAIMLIPEIALTPQMSDRVRDRLACQVGVLHSRMTPAERFDVIQAAAVGEVQVVLGARSAIFTPFRNLGLIVVDEEHEASYKQGEKPRYNARDVALMRARLIGIPVILGSATPSLESYQNVVSGKHALLEIPKRVDERPLPHVSVIDMRTEENSKETISKTLLDALASRIDAGEQSIVLLNRRGHSNYVQCFACGEPVRCPQCDISLTYHSTGQMLRCHYCDHARPVPRQCAECQNPCQVFRGLGTQRLEQDLSGLLPAARILRMDFDTTTRKGSHRQILEQVAAGEVDILLGTQMVAKGHDFPGVTLVGVINAEAGLSIPDFRATERTFQLLAQVAGRAGRGKQPGEVFIQTRMPDHYTIGLAAQQDYAGFFQREAALRQSLDYPPFGRLAAITGLGAAPEPLSAAMNRVAERLRQPGLGPSVKILGPAASAIARIRGRYREQLLIKGRLDPSQKRAIMQLLSFVARESPKIDFQIDVDPLNLL